MKISTSYWMFEGGLEGQKPVVEALREAKELGLDALELCTASSGVLTHETSRSECEDIRAAADKIGIEISSVASGESWTCSPTANDPEVRRRSIEFMKGSLQVAAWLGTDAHLFVPGAVEVFFLPDSEIIPYETCLARAKEGLDELKAVAESVKVAVCIENVWNKFLLSPLEMRDFVDSFKSEYIGCYFDVGNVLLTGYPEDWIGILGRRIKRVHIKDFDKSVGTVEGFGDLLEGDVNFEAVKAALAKVGYDGYATAEIIPFAPGRPEKTAAAMKKIFR